MDIYKYVNSFKSPFTEKPFNKIDNLILSNLMYLDFTRIVPNKKVSISLHDAGKIYLETYSRKDISRLGVAQKDAYKLLETLIESPRFKNIMLSNYRYITSLDSQFSALTFKIDKKLKFIAFEGTDELLSGWKEDAYLSFRFPVDAQKYAIDYINEVVSLFDHKIILGGHSKGGNLALVSGMYANVLIRNKIKQVISFDGPGLRREEYNSKRYKDLKPRYIHVIPTHSLVGTLLYNDEYEVVKTTKKNILAHAASTWIIDGENFMHGKQDNKSVLIEEKLNEYIASLSYKEQENVVNTIFRELERQGFKTLNDIFSFRKVLKIINNLKSIDPEIKSILSEVIEIIVTNYL